MGGYAYGPPLAVAPVPSVRRVLDYAVTEIPRAKIVMGIPNYGYDWTLPYERGKTRARTIGNIEAVAIAARQGVPIQYDSIQQAPYIEYSENGIEHIVWFDDMKSMQAKLQLVAEYRFRGVGYWNLMRYFRPNWLLLSAMYQILLV